MLSPNGQQFMALKAVNATRPQINVARNWCEELTRLVPTDQ
jgi:hypothetical protein